MRTLSRSFAGGEIMPELLGRVDLTVAQTALATCRNLITLPHGPAENRPGTEFVREVKDSSKAVRLIPFVYSLMQTMVLEFGNNYIRFHTNGATLVNAGVPYEVATPYAEADLFDLHYVQSADVMTIVHPGYAPRELRRLGALNWQLVPINFGISQAGFGGLVSAVAVAQKPPIPLPQSAFLVVNGPPGATNIAYAVQGIGDYETPNPVRIGTGAALDITQPITVSWGAVGGAIGYRLYRQYDGVGVFAQIAELSGLQFVDEQAAENTLITPGSQRPPNEQDYSYVATAVGPDGQESVASSVATASSDLTYPGNVILISIGATSVVFTKFNVYKSSGNGVFGYIGSAPLGQSLADDNIEPDYSHQPPISANPFPTALNYPQAVSYYQQRRMFAGTTNNPQNLYATRTGTESNFTANVVVRDDDAITFKISALQVSAIRHIIPLGDVMLLTNSGEYRLNSSDGGGLTPSTISVKPQSYVGANNAQPVVTDSSMLYAQARGGHIREIIYSMSDSGATGYKNTDVSILAGHLFDTKNIVDMTFAKAPYPILWAISSDGRLLGMTYVPDQQVIGWHRHDTAGLFESCTAVSEGTEDALYVVVRRFNNTKRFVERMHTRQFDQLRDAYFVDCGLTYSGAATATITGLAHLEGRTVSILGDGAVFAQRVVTGGAVTLEQAVTKVAIGLPYVSDLQTLPLSSAQLEAYGQGKRKVINKAFIRVYRSSIVKAGPDFTKLREFKQRTNEPYGSAPALIAADEIELPVTPAWGEDAQLCIRQDLPLPMTVLSISMDVTIGG